MSSLADNETRKFWAQNNVAGKKGFQSTGNPASTGIVQDGRPGKGSGGWVKGAVEQMRFEMGDGATEVRGLGMDKAIATELRASLRADGYSQKAGYGRGQEWTTHNRGGHRVIVTKHSDGTYSADSFRTGPKLYAADKARVRLGQTLQGGKQKQLDQFLKNGGSINDLLTET